MDLNYQSATWLGWAKALPDDMIRAWPVISVGCAWALLGVGELEASGALCAMPSAGWNRQINKQRIHPDYPFTAFRPRLCATPKDGRCG